MSNHQHKIAWIETIPEDEAVGAVKRAYKSSADAKSGKVDHIMKIHSLHPQTLLDHENLYRTLMYGKGPIRRPQREMNATVVSAVNKCRY